MNSNGWNIQASVQFHSQYQSCGILYTWCGCISVEMQTELIAMNYQGNIVLHTVLIILWTQLPSFCSTLILLHLPVLNSHMG